MRDDGGRLDSRAVRRSPVLPAGLPPARAPAVALP
jgi:hypothetical protein